MKKLFFFVIITLPFMLAACSPAPLPPTEDTTPQPRPTTQPASSGAPAAALAAREALAAQLGIDAEPIQVVDVTPVDWPNACLGVEIPGAACAEVITPGYRVILLVGAVQYPYHTNANGSDVRLAGTALPGDTGAVQTPVFVWESAACEKFVLSLDGIAFGRCDGALAFKPWDFDTPASMRDFLLLFGAFEAETPAGQITFNGRGPLIPTPAEQRMMAEWAKLQFDIAQSGRAGADWGLALAWSRQGGFAGFCDEVAIYRDGSVIVANCKAPGSPYPPVRLNATQLEQLYFWLDNYGVVDFSETDPAVADAMTTKMTLTGAGQAQPLEDTRRQMIAFAAELAAQTAFGAQSDTQRFVAQDALSQFFGALYTGDTILAAKLYGGETTALEAWNPDLTPDNLPALLARGCTQNGLQCLLPRTVTYRGPDVRGGYQFIVEFLNSDGSLFRITPCCQNSSGGSISSFVYSVIARDGNWAVMELPPYVP